MLVDKQVDKQVEKHVDRGWWLTNRQPGLEPWSQWYVMVTARMVWKGKTTTNNRECTYHDGQWQKKRRRRRGRGWRRRQLKPGRDPPLAGSEKWMLDARQSITVRRSNTCASCTFGSLRDVRPRRNDVYAWGAHVIAPVCAGQLQPLWRETRERWHICWGQQCTFPLLCSRARFGNLGAKQEKCQQHESERGLSVTQREHSTLLTFRGN